MSGSFALIVLVISAVAIVAILAPLRAKQQPAVAAKTGPEPASKYESTLMALRDLDFDHELGVVAEDDYQRLREELVARAAQTMPRKKSGRKKPGAKKDTARGKTPASGNEKVTATTEDGNGECPQCGLPHQPNHVFCGKCGAQLSAA